MEEEARRIVELTYVEYDASVGFPSLMLALGALVPQLVLVSLFVLVYFGPSLRRRQAVSILLGLIANQVLNHVLKLVVREPRPTHGVQIKSHYGWPSAHAQFMGFYTAFVACLMHLQRHSSKSSALAHSILNILLTIHVVISRVAFGFHTTNQVIWGVIVGLPAGFGWHLLLQTWANWSTAKSLLVASSPSNHSALANSARRLNGQS
eukprot:ANDGO_08347.mRNA.1 Dolichyldiphosphatase 1